MSKRFSHTHDFGASVDQIFELLTTEESIIARYTAAGFANVKVIDRKADGDGLELTVERTEAGGLPGPLAKFTSGAVLLRQTDSWKSADAAVERRADWAVSTRGVPVTIRGQIVITATPSGATLTQTGDVSAKVPIIGGKLESVSIDQTTAKLDAEWRWLVEQLEQETS